MHRSAGRSFQQRRRCEGELRQALRKVPWTGRKRANAHGETSWSQGLHGSKGQAEFDDAKGFKSIKEGQKINGKEAMKPFADKLTDDEIKALVTFMRTFKK